MILFFTLISIVAAFIGLYYLIVADMYDRRGERVSIYTSDAGARAVTSALLLIIISAMALVASYGAMR
jgi:hypothetical protein